MNVLEPAGGSRLRNILLLVVSLLFVAAGIGMTITGAKGGVTTTAFFGVCAAVAVWQLWPGLLETETRCADDLLARYPGPLVLRASVRRLLFLAALSAVFGGSIFGMLLQDAFPTAVRILMWAGVVLFLGGALFLIVTAIRGSSLHLDAEGLTIVQVGRSRRVRWHDTSGFAAATVKGTVQRIVVFDEAASDQGRLAAMNRQLTGRGGGLPDTYGLDPDSLAELLAEWRARAVGAHEYRL